MKKKRNDPSENRAKVNNASFDRKANQNFNTEFANELATDMNALAEQRSPKKSNYKNDSKKNY